jgi:hypothetical protein
LRITSKLFKNTEDKLVAPRTFAVVLGSGRHPVKLVEDLGPTNRTVILRMTSKQFKNTLQWINFTTTSHLQSTGKK